MNNSNHNNGTNGQVKPIVVRFNKQFMIDSLIRIKDTLERMK